VILVDVYDAVIKLGASKQILDKITMLKQQADEYPKLLNEIKTTIDYYDNLKSLKMDLDCDKHVVSILRTFLKGRV